MALYSFNTNVLSADKFPLPLQTNLSLSATGVNFLSGASLDYVTSQNVGIVSLSSTDAGLVFNPVDFSIGTSVNTVSTFRISAYPTVTVNVLGSVFNIPVGLHNTEMALVNTDNSFSVFTFLSSVATVPTSAFTETYDACTPRTRRLRNLGYR